jgi:hypothetical protein
VEASVPDLHFDTASLKNLTSSVNLANTIAISLDHRLSPEHPYQLLIWFTAWTAMGCRSF